MAQDPNNPNPNPEGGNPNPEGGNPNPEGGNPNPADDNGGGLPSASEGMPTLNFEITDNVREKFVTSDGKLLGKYETLEQLTEAHKNLQDKHAQYVEEVKNGENNLNNDIATQQADAQKIETVKSLLPEFLQNDMQLTPEMETTLTEKGIDIRDVKLGAIELRDKINDAHATVGGAENYQAMMGWAAENLSDAEKNAFDADILDVQSKFAIKGLYSAYQEALANGDTPPAQRLNGDNKIKTIQAYPDRQALLKDKQYIDSPQGKRDLAAQKRYKARLAITPEEVWRGY